MEIESVPRVLPEKQGGTERVFPERLARPISQACTRIAVRPAVKVLGPPASPSNKAQKMSCSAGPPARQLASFSREKIKIAHKIKIFSSPIHQGAVTSL